MRTKVTADEVYEATELLTAQLDVAECGELVTESR